MPGLLQTDARNGMFPPSDAAGDDSDSGEENLPPLEEYVIVNQEVSIEVNFREQSVQGESRITIYLTNASEPPDSVALDARQCEIDTAKIRVNGKPVRATYRDPYEALDLPPSWDLQPSNFPVFKNRMKSLMPRRRRDVACDKREEIGSNPADRSLRVGLRPLPPKPVPTRTSDRPAAPSGKLKVRLSTAGGSLAGTKKAAVDNYVPPADGVYEIVIPFKTTHIRDGLHFVGVDENDTRFPHVYTRHSPEPGMAACIFPCLDDPGSRCFWKIHVKTPRTLGDALMPPAAASIGDAPVHGAAADPKSAAAALASGSSSMATVRGEMADERLLQLTDEDKLLDMTVVCSGNLVGERADEHDESKKIMTFEITDHGAAASHIGFAVGPFEHVDLFTGFRTEEDDEKLGASALKIHGYCLPGRQEEVQNTCVSLTTAADEFAMTYGRYPYDSFKLCFVDDMVSDTTPLLSFALCSTRLLFPDSILDRDFDVTRKLVHALAYQYFGSYIVANQRSELWLTVGIAYYMTDLFLAKLCGNNDYRFRIKAMSDRLAEEDRGRPSLHDLGTYSYLGDFEMEFLALKAPLVLFILDKRLTKAAGSASASLARVISKIISKANTSGWGDNNNEIISSESFRRVCEKTSQYQLEHFWNQWVLGTGCPWLSIKQRFNRKRLCVEISIHQMQETMLAKPRPLRHAEFWRELVEQRHGSYERKVQRLFTGPMTIRIHEANGTPYEHIVEIREDAALMGGAKFDIPYNTKYKRLKRNRKNKERAAATVANAEGGEGHEEAIVFSLGEKLDTPEEMASWGLIDWSEQDEKNMDQESYEWIRIDSDFEWLCRMNTNMPAWMYLSQLQQDRDIVAQQDTLLYLSRIREHAMSATILTRTLYDDRYFHGLRTLAAENLTRQVWKLSDVQNGNGNGQDDSAMRDGPDDSIVYRGLDQLMHVYRHYFCYDDGTAKPNDFDDMRQYWVQGAIVEAVGKVVYEDKRPREAQKFLLDLLRFNNNSQNVFSDHLFVAKLLVALANSFCATTTKTNTAASTGAARGPRASASKDKDKDKDKDKSPGMVLTFDDGLSDDGDGDNLDDDGFNLGADLARMEADSEDKMLLDAAVSEIERYRRMDEWTSSYQNVWTTAALEAKTLLMKTGVIRVDALEFVRYLQDGTMDGVQIKAYECLVELGLLLRPAILKLFLTAMTQHGSPFVRDRLFKCFCRGLASIAFGEHDGSYGVVVDGAKDGAKDADAMDLDNDNDHDDNDNDDDDDDDDDVIIEHGDSVTKKHQEQHARRESIEAAVAALRAAVKDNKALLEALWEAARSGRTGCAEKRNLMDLLDVMFEGDHALLLTVKHPTVWRAERVSKYVVGFKKHQRPLKEKHVMPVGVTDPAAPAPATLAGAAAASATATATPLARTTVPSTATERTALPGSAPKKAASKIKLSTGRSVLSGGSGSSTAPASTPPPPVSPMIVRKPSVAVPSAAVPSASPAPASKPAMPVPSKAPPAPVKAPTPAQVKAPTPAVKDKDTKDKDVRDDAPAKEAKAKEPKASAPVIKKETKDKEVKETKEKEAKDKDKERADTLQARKSAANGGGSTSSTTLKDHLMDYGTAAASRASRSPRPSLPSLAPPAASGTSPNKRKRADNEDVGGEGRSLRPRKMLRIKVPASYRSRLSPRASSWLSTRTASPVKGSSAPDTRRAGTPTRKSVTPALSAGVSKAGVSKAVSRARSSATPSAPYKPLKDRTNGSDRSDRERDRSDRNGHSRSNSQSTTPRPGADRDRSERDRDRSDRDRPDRDRSDRNRDRDRERSRQAKRPTPAPAVTALPSLKGEAAPWRSPDKKSTNSSSSSMSSMSSMSFSATLAGSSKASMSGAVRKALPGPTHTASASPRPSHGSGTSHGSGSRSATPATSAKPGTPAPAAETSASTTTTTTTATKTSAPGSKPIVIKFKTKPKPKPQ